LVTLSLSGDTAKPAKGITATTTVAILTPTYALRASVGKLVYRNTHQLAAPQLGIGIGKEG
jgi:hypothetical protein